MKKIEMTENKGQSTHTILHKVDDVFPAQPDRRDISRREVACHLAGKMIENPLVVGAEGGAMSLKCVCDRCGNCTESPGFGMRIVVPRILLEIEFVDLCDRCRSVVVPMLERIAHNGGRTAKGNIVCEVCGESAPSVSGGKTAKRYCSIACKSKAQRERKAGTNLK